MRILLEISEERRDYARRLLHCLAVSTRLLRVEELAEILAIQFDPGEFPSYDVIWRPEDSEEAVLSTCSSLVTVVNVGNTRMVQFSHFSVKEYLILERLANAGKDLSHYHILPALAHTILAQASLSVLLSLDDQVDKDSMKKLPFAIYAAQHWVEHARFRDVATSIENAIDRLFDGSKPQFATWIWIYDIDNPYREIMFEAHPTLPKAVPLYYATLCGFGGLVKRLVATFPEDVNTRGGVLHYSIACSTCKG